jgi:hypothetical protein
MKIPNTINAGDSANWRDEAWTKAGTTLRYASTEWTLSYELRGPTQITLLAVPEGDGWRTSLSMVTSSQLQAGEYACAAYLSKAGERVTMAFAKVTVRADLAQVAVPVDSRSAATRALADCEAALAKFSSSGGKIKSYTIGTRQTEFASLSELLSVRRFWQRRVNMERGVTGRVLVRF